MYENRKQYRDQLSRVKYLIGNAIALSKATGAKDISQQDENLRVKIQPMTNDFSLYASNGEARGIEITGMYIDGDVGTTIRAVRSIARTFKALVTADFNGTPMTSLPRSTQREVGLDWSFRRVLHQHPEINP